MGADQRMSPSEARYWEEVGQQVFWDVVTRGGRAGCVICQLYGPEHGLNGERCSGPKDAHHVIPKRMIRSALSPIPSLLVMDAPERTVDTWTDPRDPSSVFWEWDPQKLCIADPRNGITVRRAHHEALESPTGISLHPPDLVKLCEDERTPFHVFEFIQDWGLEAIAERCGIVLA